jgi:hypothetical protein
MGRAVLRPAIPRIMRLHLARVNHRRLRLRESVSNEEEVYKRAFQFFDADGSGETLRPRGLWLHVFALRTCTPADRRHTCVVTAAYTRVAHAWPTHVAYTHSQQGPKALRGELRTHGAAGPSVRGRPQLKHLVWVCCACVQAASACRS